MQIIDSKFPASGMQADMSETVTATIDRNTLVTEFGGILHSIVRKMVWDAETARDAAQEVWCEILKSLSSFQGNSELSTWIYTISHPCCHKICHA